MALDELVLRGLSSPNPSMPRMSVWQVSLHHHIHLSRLSGWTVDPEALDKHLKHLEERRAALLDRKSHCVCVEVKAELDAELQAAERHREQLSLENEWLKVL